MEAAYRHQLDAAAAGKRQKKGAKPAPANPPVRHGTSGTPRPGGEDIKETGRRVL